MYLSDSKIISSGGKNYLEITLDQKYGFEVVINGVKKTQNSLYFEEPEMANMEALKACSVSIEKLHQHARVEKQIGLLSKLDDDQLSSIIRQKIDDSINIEASKQAEKANLDAGDKEDFDTAKASLIYTSFMASLLNDSQTFDDGKRNYFNELQRFIDLLDERMRMLNSSSFMPSTIDFNNLSFGKLADTLFIKEAIVCQYVGFFFSHFPSKSLSMA